MSAPTSAKTDRREPVRRQKDVDEVAKKLLQPETSKVAPQLPPCEARVRQCLESAVLWADELPRYAGVHQSKADFWAIAAGIVASITGLAIFPVLTDSSTTTQKFLVSSFAFLAAALALVPRIRNYSEQAGQARTLAGVYGPLVGRLLDALVAIKGRQGDDEAVRAVLADFEAAKTKKDELRYVASGQRLADLRSRAKARVEELTK